jgi:hypothetical protein
MKLYRPGRTPVLRGTAYRLSPNRALLWTAGYVPELMTYPGREVPNPLLVDISRGEADLGVVMRDVMGLTKVNFNSCIFSDGLPVTLRFAEAVGEIPKGSVGGCRGAITVRRWVLKAASVAEARISNAESHGLSARFVPDA